MRYRRARRAAGARRRHRTPARRPAARVASTVDGPASTATPSRADAARARGARAAARARAAPGSPQLPWRRLVNPFRPLEILSADHVEAIHRASLRILAEIGVEVLGDRALDAFAGAGATVDRDDAAGPARPRPGRGAHRHARPREFTLHARNPARDIVFGGAEPRVRRGRRAGVRHATSTAAGAPATSPTSSTTSGSSAPSTSSTRRAAARSSRTTCRSRRATSTCTGRSRSSSTRPGSAWASARDRVDDALEVACLVRGVDRDTLARASPA